MDREAGENPLSNKQLQRSQVSKVKNHSRSPQTADIARLITRREGANGSPERL